MTSHSGSSADVKSSIRTIEIIELLSHHPDGLTFTEIQNSLDIPKSSLFVLLGSIQKEQWITFDMKSNCFRMGIRAWETTQRFISNLMFAKLAEEHLTELRNELQTSVQLAVLEKADILYIAQSKADNHYDLPAHVGVRAPANATALGKSLLSGLKDKEIIDLYRDVVPKKFNDTTITDMDEILKVASQTRGLGFSEANGDMVERFFCVASPVKDSSGKVIAAMSSTIPKKDLVSGERTKEQMREATVKEAESLSRELGWKS